MLYDSREAVIKLFNGYSSIVSKAKYKTIHGEGRPSDLATWLKILTPKQLLQVLPTALAQVKAGNISENLLNEIRQMMYSLYRAKEIIKEVYIDIMNSIKL